MRRFPVRRAAAAMRAAAYRLTAQAARLRAAEAGVAAVEFAMILPVMVTLYFGLVELTLAVVIDRKAGMLARSLADLSSRSGQQTTSSLDNIMDGAVMILRPYDSTAIQMVVTSVLVTQSNNTYTGTVDWSCGRHIVAKASGQTQTDYDAANLSVRSSGSSYTVPPGFQTTSTQSFMLVETQMPYTSPLGRFVVGTRLFREVTPWPVRNGAKVLGPGTCPSNT